MTKTYAAADLSLSQLVTLYNCYADKPVKAFRDKPTAIKRVEALADGRVIVLPMEGGYAYEYPAMEAERTVHEDTVPVSVAEPAAAEPVAVNTPATGVSKRRGPQPSVSSDMVFATVAPIKEARRGPKVASYHRYALYAVGKTVGDFLAEAVALQGKTTGRWRGDVLWDIKHGYITVCTAAEYEAAKRLAA